jgi:AraC-like DNA-binding protein
MGRFESSVTAAVVPGRIVTLVAARTVRNKAHFRLLLREAADRSCRRIETELGVTAVAGVGTVREHIGKTPQSYEDAVAEIASAAASLGSELSRDQARDELMQLGTERVAQLGTVSSEESEELLRRIAVLGARVADEDMPWVVGFSCYVVGGLVEGQRMRPAVTTGPVERIASSTLSRLSRVTDPVAWEECFIEALREFREVLAPNGANRRDAVRAQKAMAFIDAHCHRKLSVDEVAAHVYLSKSRFKTVFKQQTGVTCAEYLSQRRLELARGMLGASPMSIGEIAGRLGFSCSNSFARWFRQGTSVSPREFRQGLSSQTGS